MKKIKNKIVLGLLISCIALTATSISLTGAWYYNATILRVDNLTISTGDNYELKVATSKNGEYKSDLTDDDLNNLYSDIGYYVPVSSMYHSLWDTTISLSDVEDSSSMPIFYSGYQSNSPNKTTDDIKPDKATGGYLSIPLYLMVNADCYVSIDKDNSYFLSDTEKNTEYFNKYHPSGVTLDDLEKLSNSMRYSLFVPEEKASESKYYIIDLQKDENTTYFGGILNTSHGSKYYDIFYDSSDSSYKECLYGDIQNRDKIIYSDLLEEDIDEEGSPSTFTAKHKKGTKRVLLDESINNGVIIKEEDSADLTTLGSANSSLMIPCSANKAKLVVLSIYMEGWDKECINSTMGASFKSKIAFNVVRER